MIKSKWCKRTLVPLALLTAATMFTVATGNTLLTVAEAASGETSKYYSDYDSMEALIIVFNGHFMRAWHNFSPKRRKKGKHDGLRKSLGPARSRAFIMQNSAAGRLGFPRRHAASLICSPHFSAVYLRIPAACSPRFTAVFLFRRISAPRLLIRWGRGRRKRRCSYPSLGAPRRAHSGCGCCRPRAR